MATDTKTRHYPEKVAYEAADYLDVNPKDPHWGMICWPSVENGTEDSVSMSEADLDDGEKEIRCTNCGTWVILNAEGEPVDRSESLEENLFYGPQEDDPEGES